MAFGDMSPYAILRDRKLLVKEKVEVAAGKTSSFARRTAEGGCPHRSISPH
jgi:hypothetical protein